MDERKYRQTHPWITFELDLRSRPLPWTTWILLGAVQSKCKHLAGIPLRPEKQQEMLKVSMRKGIRATTAIEGNTLSEEEVEKIIEGKAELPKSKEYQRKEVENVLRIYNDIAAGIQALSSCEIGCGQIKSDNAVILDNLERGEDVVPGQIRTHSVHVQNYVGAPAEDCEYLLDRLCEWLKESWGFGEENRIIEAVLKAILAHLYIAWIHPFADGNGRTARALELRILMSAGIPMNAAHLLSNHYNETRTEYYYRLDMSSRKSRGNPEGFIAYAVQGLVDALDNQIKIILSEQLDITWRNFVYSCFEGQLTSAGRRQRDLLLEISDFKEPMEQAEIRKRLSDKLLGLYEDKTLKAFRRDVNALIQKGLLTREGTKLRAARDRVMSRWFFPALKARPDDRHA